MDLPLEELQPNDVGFMVDCLTGRGRNTSKWNQASVADWAQRHPPKYGVPMAFQHVPHYIDLRHTEFQQELAEDERMHPPITS